MTRKLPDGDIVTLRLHSQRLTALHESTPSDTVAWLSALQGQDHEAAKWAIGLRSGADLAAVEAAVDRGDFVRTWLLRGTLHMVAAADVYWMLALVGPRLIANSARRYQQLGLDDDTLASGCDTLAGALHDRSRLTRAEMFQVLEQAGISTEGQRGYHILRHAGLCAITCHGPKDGKQETFVLLDEWLPSDKGPEGEEAVAELAWRYFRSHGPATLRDFVWWSGLRVSQARAALAALSERLEETEVGGQTFWKPYLDEFPRIGSSPSVRLLPAFDEYYLGYQDRSAVLEAALDSSLVSSNGYFRPAIIVDGQVIGRWKVNRSDGSIAVEIEPFRDLTPQETDGIAVAARQYGAYLGMPGELSQLK